MFKWLNIQDISNLFKITENTPQKEVDRAVNDAYDMDIIPVLSDTLMAAIKDILEGNVKQWNRLTTYVTGDKVFYNGVYYSAVTGSTGEAPANAKWEEIELMTFWGEYVKKYFAACVYYRLMLWQGVNVTQYGVVNVTEETSQQISDKQRGDIMADIRGKRDIYLARLNKKFSDVGGEFDGVTYATDCEDNSTPNQGVQVWAVGVNRVKREKNKYP